VGVRRTSPASETTLVSRRSAVRRGRSVRYLGASEMKMRLFFPCGAEGIRGWCTCVVPGRALDRELLGEPSPGRCVHIINVFAGHLLTL
jgi:hypothetical protein